jgi:limonene-1,2-epoxide hydrolase
MTSAAEATVIAFLERFHASTLDIAKVRAALADDARYQPIVPLSQPVQGADAICAELERQYKIYADCQCTILNIASTATTVFTERVDRCRQLSDNRETVVHVTGVFDLDDDGRIIWWREYWDALDIADQVGVSADVMKSMMVTA